MVLVTGFTVLEPLVVTPPVLKLVPVQVLASGQSQERIDDWGGIIEVGVAVSGAEQAKGSTGINRSKRVKAGSVEIGEDEPVAFTGTELLFAGALQEVPLASTVTWYKPPL